MALATKVEPGKYASDPLMSCYGRYPANGSYKNIDKFLRSAKPRLKELKIGNIAIEAVGH